MLNFIHAHLVESSVLAMALLDYLIKLVPFLQGDGLVHQLVLMLRSLLSKGAGQ